MNNEKWNFVNFVRKFAGVVLLNDTTFITDSAQSTDYKSTVKLFSRLPLLFAVLYEIKLLFWRVRLPSMGSM